jgi:hypothetical protein
LINAYFFELLVIDEYNNNCSPVQRFGQCHYGDVVVVLALIPLEQQGRIQIGAGSPQAHQPRNPPGHDHEQGRGTFQSLHTINPALKYTPHSAPAGDGNSCGHDRESVAAFA